MVSNNMVLLLVVVFGSKLRAGSSRHVLSFTRRFVVSYFLLNQTISIFEPRQDNTGLAGGKFLERVKVKKDGCEVSPTYGCDEVSSGARRAWG